jgi:hypothetical protein
VQVLDAVARVLQLDVTEREHLYRLAGIPFVREPVSDVEVVGQEVLGLLATLDPLPAAVYNARYDVQASNATYRTLWPMASLVERWERNILYKLFVTPECCPPSPTARRSCRGRSPSCGAPTDGMWASRPGRRSSP